MRVREKIKSMKMLWLPFILIAIGGIIVTFGDIVLKKWTITNNYWLFILGFIIYTVGTVFLAFSFKYKNIAIASLMFILFNVIALVIISWFYFNEKLNTLQLIGLVIGLVSITLLQMSEN